MSRWIFSLELASLLSLMGCVLWIFMWTPLNREMGFVQKIMYLHVPSVFVTYAAFFMTFVYSFMYLWKRNLSSDHIAKSSAEIGLIFCGLTLITGAIWGKPTWGTYWVWDARLTTTLLLFLIFCGYFLLRAFSTERHTEAKLASIIGIIGFLDIPIIHKSVEWWRTLHQPSTLFKAEKPAMPPELLYPLIASVFAMFIVYVYLLVLRIQAEQKKDQYYQQLYQLQNEEVA